VPIEKSKRSRYRKTKSNQSSFSRKAKIKAAELKQTDSFYMKYLDTKKKKIIYHHINHFVILFILFSI
jgi:hypothetical protein